MTEDALAELLSFFRREGRFAFVGGSIMTYPGADANNHELYQGCRELECRGLIRRVWQHNHAAGAVVLFRPIAQAPGVEIVEAPMVIKHDL